MPHAFLALYHIMPSCPFSLKTWFSGSIRTIAESTSKQVFQVSPMERDWILEGMNRGWLVVKSRDSESEGIQLKDEVSREGDCRFRFDKLEECRDRGACIVWFIFKFLFFIYFFIIFKPHLLVYLKLIYELSIGFNNLLKYKQVLSFFIKKLF